MQNKLTVVLITLISALLIGCGAIEPNASISEENDSNMEEITVLVMDKEVVSTEDYGWWRDSWYIGDNLYYIVKSRNGEASALDMEVYVKAGEEVSKLLLTADAAVMTSFAVDESENIYYLSTVEDSYFLHKADSTGSELFVQRVSSEIGEIIRQENCLGAVASVDGYCMITSLSTVFTWDARLQETGQLHPSWQNMIPDYGGNQDYGLLIGTDGDYAFFREGSNILLQKVDTVTRNLEEEIRVEVPVSAMQSPDSLNEIRLYSGYEKGIYVFSEDILYVYDDSDKVLDERLSWRESTVKVDMNDVDVIGEDESGAVMFAGYDGGREEGILIRAEEKTITEYQTIVIGYLDKYTGENVEEYINEFNMLRGDVQVVCKQYKDLNELHLALIKGEGPDIIGVNELDIDEYTEKGILEDLGPYFAASTKLKEEDILPSLREVMTRDGTIRYVFPQFGLNVMLMNSDIATEGGMTTDEFLALKAAGEKNYLCEKDAEVLLWYILCLQQDKYIDWQNKSCSFDDGDFAELLEKVQAADLPERTESSSMFTVAMTEKIYQGRILASYDAMISCMQDYRAIKEAFGDDVKIMGYPNDEREENYPIYANVGWLGINSASKCKEEAWEFLEFYLLYYADTHNKTSDNFSVLTDKFEEQLYPQPGDIKQKYTNPYSQMRGLDVTFDYSEDDRNLIRYMVDHAVLGLSVSGNVGEIIMEEAAYFFEGAKTAEEVADIIQSRVSIYMEE